MRDAQRRLIAHIALTAIVLTPLAAAAESAIDIKIHDQQARIHDVHLQLHQKRGELETVKVRVQTLQAQVDETNRNIAVVTSKLDDLAGQLRSTQRKLEWNRIQLLAAQETVRRHDAALAGRLVSAYEYGDLGYLEVLLAARTFDDFVERWNDIRYVIRQNQQTIRARRAALAQVAAIQASLTADQSALQALSERQRQQQHALDALADQRRGLLAAADQQRRNVATQVAQLDEISESAAAALESLIREREREEEARREAERQAALRAGHHIAPRLGAPGALSWPLSGPITSPFGMRLDPYTHRFHLHAGIDIAADMGTTITAAAGGQVIIAGWNDGGYGNMVVIEHGGSLSTLYGHMSHIYVAAGQAVQRGQAIGAVGSTGWSTGPHCHFEVRRSGTPVDPMSYLH